MTISRKKSWTEEHRTYYRDDETSAEHAKAEATAVLAGDLLKRSRSVADDLAPEVDRAHRQMTQREAYLRSPNLAHAVQLLKTGAEVRCSRNASSATASQSADTRKHVRALHEASTLPDDHERKRPGCADGSEIASRRLFAIQAHPTLGRLFNLVLDVEGNLADLDARLQGSFAAGLVDIANGPETTLIAGFAFLSCNIGSAPEGPKVWTIAKATRPSNSSIATFWPCTREEMEMVVAGAARDAILASCAVDQVDGLLDLGMTFVQDENGTSAQGTPPCGTHRRFDLVSVDTILSTEADVRRERHAQDAQDLADRAGSAAPDAARLPPPRPSLTTAGLALIDRWRQEQVAAEIATGRFYRGRSGSVVLDAEDLTVGYKIDLGVRVKGGWTWRTLMNRTVAFTLPDAFAHVAKLDRGIVERLIGRLVPDAVERELLDSGTVSVASRLRGPTGATSIHFEENIADWQGDPLGASCQTQSFDVDADLDLGLSRAYGLRSGLDDPNAAAHAALPCRFGWSYRMGVRACYVGGGALPFAMAASRYDAEFDGRLTAPRRLEPAECGSAAATGGRRVLRHEPVGKPIVLQTAIEASAPTTLSPQSSDVVVLRTCSTDPTRSHPGTSRRIVLAPRALQAFAARHGVFDHLNGDVERPPGGLAAIDFDAPWGEFPLFGAAFGAVSGGSRRQEATPSRSVAKWHLALETFASGVSIGIAKIAGGTLHAIPMSKRVARTWTWAEAKADLERRRTAREFDARSWLQAAGASELTIEGSLDDAARLVAIALATLEGVVAVPDGRPVYRPIQPSAARERARVTPYYPDPAADLLVIAARWHGTVRYLPGDPTIVALDRAAPYPETRPVAIDFVRLDGCRERVPTQSDVVRRLHDGRGRDVALGATPAGAAVVEVRLAWGEHVSIDVWCLPTASRLRGIFDAVESIAVCATDLSAPGSPATEACLSGLAAKAGTPTPVPEGGGHAWCGSAGVPATSAGIGHAASVLFGYMSRRPMPDIAAVATIDALNAIDRTVHAPSFAGVEDHVRLGLYRTAEDRDRLLHRPSWGPPVDMAEEGSAGVLFGGVVRIDRSTTGVLELRVSCVAPRGSELDAGSRRRTDAQRHAGAWPTRPDDPQRLLKASEIFGFEVASDGRVKLRETADVALTFDGIAERSGDPSPDGLDEFDLLAARVVAEPTHDEIDAEARRRAAGAPVTTIGEKPPLFPGGLARRLTLTLVATARNLPHFRRTIPRPDGTVEERFPPHSAEQVATSEPVVRWLPATRRPDKVKPRSITPAFLWSHGRERLDTGVGTDRISVSARRNAVLRVRMERGWYSSGLGERLALVIWPPDLAALDVDDLSDGRVPRRDPSGATLDELMDLSDFDDASLGEGGPFITRWGADPIRSGAGPEGPLMPRRAFRDLEEDVLRKTASPRDDGAEDDAPSYVGDALMPLPLRTGEDVKASRRFMRIALLAYEPRFDVDRECWFVDVALDPIGMVEPFVRLGLVRFQPHAPANLQVSEPIVEWAQILPVRTARAEVGSRVSGFWPVHVEVVGDAARRSRSSVPTAGFRHAFPSDRPRVPGLPRMRMRLVRVAVTSGGSQVRAAAEVVDTPFAASGTDGSGTQGAEIEIDANQGSADASTGSCSWRHTFYATEDPRGSGTGDHLIVEVEEFDLFAPATYPHEPISAGDDVSREFIENGPRFVAILELLGASPAGPRGPLK